MGVKGGKYFKKRAVSGIIYYKLVKKLRSRVIVRFGVESYGDFSLSIFSEEVWFIVGKE